MPKVGGTKDPDLARLRALAPTHLVVNVDENRREDVEAAREFVPHVIVTHPLEPADNLHLFALFGEVFAREREAVALANELVDAMAFARQATQALPREDVLYLIWRKPWMTASRETYVSASLGLVGWDTLPATASLRYPALAEEGSEWRDAACILLSTEPYAFRERDAAALRERWRKPVHVIDGEWTSWYGSRAIAGLRSLAQMRTTAGRESPA